MTLKEIGEAVCNAREEKGLTQRELAALLGVSEATINLVENGSTRSGKVLLNKIANFFGITFDLTFPYDDK